MHPMSPFKGQGANTALNDGVILTSYLQQSSTLYKALSNFERVRVDKGCKNVLLSRDAAKFLHSEDVILIKEESRKKKLCNRDVKFIGSREKCFDNVEFLKVLEQRGVTADLGDGLDDAVKNIMIEFFDQERNDD